LQHRRSGFWALLVLCLVFLCGCSRQLPATSLHLYDSEQTIAQLRVDNIPSDPAATTDPPQYAMWFSVNDYPEILMTQTEAAFTATIQQRFANAAAMGINTVYVHVRAFGDAYYTSDLFDKGLYTPENMDFDPLEIMVEAAHAQSLSIHAWINPLRCQTDSQMQEMDDQYPIKQWYNDPEKRGTYLSLVDGRWWLNPAYPDVRRLIAEGAAEIVQRYAVDGIHIDDYFYPTTDAAFDAAAFAESTETDLTTFRMMQCNQMVAALYDAVKSANPDVLFGISPQGTRSGNEAQYADVETWCSQSGYCDYIVPQIYFGLENEVAPFAETVASWQDMVTCDDVTLIIGICTYKMGTEDTYAGSGSAEWQTDFSVSSKELSLVQQLGLGAAFYSYSSTFEPASEIAVPMAEERAAIAAMLCG
jgi:uncharacterized lipoprotein YddW (UPF0748 family)